MLYFLLFSVAFCTSWSDCRFSFSQTFGLQDCEYICNYRFCFKCLNWILPHVFLSFSVGVQVYLIFWNIFNILNVLCVFLLCRLSSLAFWHFVCSRFSITSNFVQSSISYTQCICAHRCTTWTLFSLKSKW